MKQVSKKSAYHHGDLRRVLVEDATVLIKKAGIEGLSLRKLAENVGVSRTAPYHHFKDKNQLLCAIAEEGFRHWQNTAESLLNRKDLTAQEKYRQIFYAYIQYAADNPQLYELMFGRTIWKQQSATDSLRQVAYPSFQFQVNITRQWQDQGVLPATEDPLRLAQVTWGTMHGIARLLIDGIYADRSHIEEMCDTAINLFVRP